MTAPTQAPPRPGGAAPQGCTTRPRKRHANRPAALREAHRARVAEILVTEPGRTARDVAAELGVDHSTVVRDGQAIRREWAAQRLEHAAEYVGRELANLEHQRAEAYRGWERSLEEVRTERAAERRTQRRPPGVAAMGGGGPGGNPEVPFVEVRTTTERTVRPGGGDPRFLLAAIGATAAIVDLLGLQGLARPRRADDVAAEPASRAWATAESRRVHTKRRG